MKRKDIKVVLFYAVLIAVILVFLVYVFKSSAVEPPTYDKVVQYFTNEEVAEFEMSPSNVLTLTLKDGTKVTYKVASLSLFHADLGELITQQMADGIITKGEYKPAGNSSSVTKSRIGLAFEKVVKIYTILFKSRSVFFAESKITKTGFE